MSFKKRELKIYKHGYADLATAVLQQWNIDGRPRGDIQGVTLWAELLQSHQNMMHNTQIKQGSLCGIKRKKK